MRLTISKVFAKVGNSYNTNISRFLSKERISQLLYNVINVKKIRNKDLKSKSFEAYDTSYTSNEKIGFIGYGLLVIPIAAFTLGTWQVQRLQWKLDLLEKLKNRVNHEPIQLPANLEDLKSKEYYPIKVKGKFLYEKEFVVGYRSLLIDGKPASNSFMGNDKTQRGYHVITPFKLADQDLTILVNRGWIPRSLKTSAKRKENQITGETEIIGILKLNERKPPFIPKNRLNNDMMYYRDVDAMAEKGDASPVYIEMISNSNSQQYPIGSQTKVELRNEHFSYLLTWYCLSATTAYMWYRQFIKKIPFAVPY